jgi:uncharacterized protein YdaU (DUF1376 family)
MNSPAFQFYVKQWLGDRDVILMDWDARGMHLHFMCIAWQEDPPCSLPNNDAYLRKLVGNPRRWSKVKKQIFRAWKLENKRWIQCGLLREYEKQRRFSESRKLNANKRWHHASALLGQCETDALQSSSSSSSSTAVLKPPLPPSKGGTRKSRSIHLGDNNDPRYREDWEKRKAQEGNHEPV